MRRPAVAGYFYPDEADALRRAMGACEGPDGGPRAAACAMVLPHGSLRQSGAIAAAACRGVRIPRRCVVVSPSHTESHLRWSVVPSGAFETPLGDVEVDAAFVEALCGECAWLEHDAWGQRGEHGIEVVLPWLQAARPEGFSLVPIVTNSEDVDECVRVGRHLAARMRVDGADETLVIASANLSHYEPIARAAEQDRRLIEAIQSGDVVSLAREITACGTAMCGFGAVACAMTAAEVLGATQTSLIRYGTSLEAGGDATSVVGYAGLVMR